MTSVLFEEWLDEWNGTLKAQNQHVLLWVDNFSGHTLPASITNIRMEFFSPNLTSHIQPMDAGIIWCFKAHYQKLFVARSIDCYDVGIHSSKIYDINQLEAMHLADIAWSHVRPKVHRNCWAKAGILPLQDSASENPVMSIDNLLNPAQSAEQELEAEVDELVERGCLQRRHRMDLEEMLNPKGEHGSGILTHTNEEIVEALQGINLDVEVMDLEDQGVKVCVVSRKEALKAMDTLQCFVSDCTDEWARSLETALIAMTHKTQYKAVKNIKDTVITSYFGSNTQQIETTYQK